jgi:hypothetical protein
MRMLSDASCMMRDAYCVLRDPPTSEALRRGRCGEEKALLEMGASWVEMGGDASGALKTLNRQNVKSGREINPRMTLMLRLAGTLAPPPELKVAIGRSRSK